MKYSMNKSQIKGLLFKYERVTKILFYVANRFLNSNKFIYNRSNILSLESAFLRRCRVNIVGNNNKIEFSKLARLTECDISIIGSNNYLFIGEETVLSFVGFAMEDNNNIIRVHENCRIYNGTNFAAIEGTQITINKDCLFSSNIQIRTGDSHSIVNSLNERINPSKSITFGEHVWIGQNVTVLKGVEIGENSIVGSGSVVTKSFNDANIVIAGNPAKIIKKNVNWLLRRI